MALNQLKTQIHRSHRTWLAALLAGISLASAHLHAAETSNAPISEGTDTEPIVFFDLTYLFKLDLNDDAQRRRFWDESHLVTALEGLVNRDRPRLFIRYVREPDDFWWQQMTQPDGWLAKRKIVRVESLEELLKRFENDFRGAVVWDERVPATSNLASTIAGCDNLLPLRFDPRPNSLYERLTQGTNSIPIRASLLGEHGEPKFTGSGTIPDTHLSSSGSSKCDAYLWLIEKYVRTGKVNPLYMGYYLEAFWLKCWSAAAPENATLCNQDYVIAHRGVLFDLGVWDDETPVDDPNQKPGTDPDTLKKLLGAEYDRFNGNSMIHVAGFVPWAYKYTSARSPSWFAGGKHDGVPTEWHYAEILSCFNAYMDADALGLGAMANASFYQHYPLADRYPQNPKPTRTTLKNEGLLNSDGQVLPQKYISIYVGDYDSAAWLYRKLPAMWNDPARGTIPLSWAFNPNLSDRFPLGMAWAREHRTANDWFVAGDSGAGYLNPGYLTPPRKYSGLPSGLDAWTSHCEEYFKRWDISLTGFIIDGYAPKLNSDALDAYARFSPDGIVSYQKTYQGVHKDMPFIQMYADIDGSPAKAAGDIRRHVKSSSHRFYVFRTILKTPGWHAAVFKELDQMKGDRIKVVDLYTLMALIRAEEDRRSTRN
ncbi:hypothetical protein GC207_09045 [bacterium]|nr:hypothetical protein [bacterium]